MKKILMSIVAMVLLVPALSLAADVRSSETVTKEEQPHNLYLAGQNPTVDANVTGDLVVAGGTVTVNGNVENGILAAGGTLMLNGTVGENVRVAGGTVNVESVIGGDLVVFGGDVVLGTKSVVKGDLLVYGGTVTVKGEVVGSIKNSYAGSVDISGKVGGNVELAQVDTLNVASSAVIAGNLKYSSRNQASVASDAKVGGSVEYTKVTTTARQSQSMGSRFGGIVFSSLMAFITLIVFINLLPKFSSKVVNQSLVKPWSKMGAGFLGMVVTPIVLLVLLISVLGWGIMGYLATAYFAFFALTGSLSALLIGSYVWKYLRKEAELTLNWKTAAIGVLIAIVLKNIPLIGWLAGLLVGLIVFGTLVTMSLDYIKVQRA